MSENDISNERSYGTFYIIVNASLWLLFNLLLLLFVFIFWRHVIDAGFNGVNAGKFISHEHWGAKLYLAGIYIKGELLPQDINKANELMGVKNKIGERK